MSAWWDDDHKLLLITAAELATLPDGVVLTCIDSTTAIKGRDELDDDERFGHLAYGVTDCHPFRVAALEKLVSAGKPAPFTAPPHIMWECRIGIMEGRALPDGADAPMRQAVEAAFLALTGVEATFNFSGWGAELTAMEYDVIADKS